VDPPDTGFSLV